jgi:hypothetical protein
MQKLQSLVPQKLKGLKLRMKSTLNSTFCSLFSIKKQIMITTKKMAQELLLQVTPVAANEILLKNT